MKGFGQVVLEAGGGKPGSYGQRVLKAALNLLLVEYWNRVVGSECSDD